MEALTVELQATTSGPGSPGPLDAAIRSPEVAARRIEAAMVAVAGECDRRSHHRPDGTVLRPADAA